jgi:PAS domain S-box-containing protein
MRRIHWAILAAGLAMTGGALVLVFTSDHETDAAFTAAVNLVVVWSFIGSGVFAWARRPDNRFGPLMTAVGLTWLLGALGEANHSVPFTLGQLLGALSIGIFLHALLAYPRGYLETKLVWSAVLSAYAVVTLGPLADLLFSADACEGCPENALLLVESEAAVTVVGVAAVAATAYGLVATAVVLARRWRAASAPLRRVLGPVFATSAVTLLLLGLGIAVSLVSEAASEVLWWLVLFAYASVPLAFLAGLLRTRMARTAVARLVVELGASAGPESAREALRRALGDPSLELAYWIPENGRYLDVEGRPLELEAAAAGSATTPVEHEGELVAVLIHDPTLTDQQELLHSVSAAASLALARERTVQALRQSERRYRALLNAIPDLMFRLDRDGVYLDYKGDPADLAVPPAQLLGNRAHNILPAGVADQLVGGIRHAISTGEVVTGDYELELDGVERHFEARIVKDGEEAVMIVRDITARKTQEAELRRSRARIVEAGDVERRRLERNLHDGAQQRLVSVSLALRLAQARLGSDRGEAERLLTATAEELGQVLEELRELARGIHPAVLTDRGLGPALEALVARAPLPVELALADANLPAPVEAAAYYVVSEALANVAKYAQASGVAVRVERANGRAVVEVADDGVGGADPGRGSGLRGLADRVEALDGRLSVESAPGSGTRIRAEIPCA